MPKGVKNPLWFGLASRLKAFREANSLTVIELTRRTGIPNTTVFYIESGQSQPRLDTVERLAAALGVSPCWLAFGHDGKGRFTARIPRNGSKPRLPRSSGGALPFDELFSGCSARLRERRQAYGLTLRALAEEAGVSHQTIMNIEKGHQVPRLDVVHRLAVSLDMAPCWLAYGVGQKPGRVKRPIASPDPDDRREPA